jgi:hypothetical protein
MRPSGLSSGRRRPDPPFFLDRMLSGERIVEAIRAHGLGVEVIEDHHDQKTPDAQWLTTVGQKSWIGLTRDQDIRRSPLTLEAIRAARATMFCLTADNFNADTIGDFICRHSALLHDVARSYRGPFVANIDRHGHVWFVRGGTASITFTLTNDQRRSTHQVFTKATLAKAAKKKASKTKSSPKAFGSSTV